MVVSACCSKQYTRPPYENVELKAFPVVNIAQLKGAFSLVYKRYIESGYTESHPSAMRYSIYSLFPSTLTLVATKSTTIVGTLSLVNDTQAGVPSDAIFRDILDKLRDEQSDFVELSMLACAEDVGIVHWALMRSAITFAVYAAKQIVFVVNPRHVRFYELLGFNIIGKERDCSCVKGAPGVLMHGDPLAVMQDRRRMTRLAKKIYPEFPAFDYQIWRPSSRDLLELLRLRREIVDQATTEQLLELRKAFPGLELAFQRKLSQQVS